MISSFCNPFDSRNAILRSVGASRIDSSSRNLAAWFRRADLDELSAPVALSELDCSGVAVASQDWRCHSGMAGCRESGPAILLDRLISDHRSQLLLLYRYDTGEEALDGGVLVRCAPHPDSDQPRPGEPRKRYLFIHLVLLPAHPYIISMQIIKMY